MPSYDATVLADAPYAYWPCNEATGTALADATGSGRTMALSGSYTLAQAGIPGDAAGGSVLWSGGHATWAETVNNPTDYAVELWLWLPSAVTGQVIPFSNNPINVHLDLIAGVATWSPNAASFSGGGAINDGAWHHVVGVRSASGSNGYTAGSSYLFVDGVQVNSEAGTGTGAFGAYGTWEIGAYGGTLNFATGRTAKVVLWHSTPSAATIAAHHTAGITGGGSPLASGTASTVSAGNTTASVTVADATGGTSPYAYQWYRSTASGFTPGVGNLVSGATSQTLDDTGLTNGTTYYYINVVTDSAGTPATAASNQTAATPSITATATFAATDAAVLRCGQINPGYTAGRAADEPISLGAGYDFTLTNCTDLSIPLYRSAAAGMTVSIDGGAAAALTMPATGAWADVVVFSGLSTAAHAVSLRLTSGSTYVAVDATNTFKASNVGSPTAPTISATKAGPSYRIIDPAFRRNASVEGASFLIPSMNTGTYNTPVLDWPVYCGQRVAFRGDPTEIRLFMDNGGATLSLVVDGVVTGGKVTAPSTGLNDWLTVASGLSGVHDYAVQGDAGGSYQIFAVQLVGGTLATKSFPAAGHLVIYGDSISVATGTTRASLGFAAQVARAKGRRLLNLAIGGATVSSSVDAGRTGTISAFAGDYLAWVGPGWDTSQDEVVILAGFNDADYIGDLTAFMAAYSSALTRLADTGATVRVLGYLESLGGPATTNRTAWNSALSAHVSGMGLPRITYHDTTGWVNTATDLADMVHLNQTGDDKVATQLNTIVTAWTAPAGGGGGTYTAASNVRSGTDRGDGTLGTLVVPAASSVVTGTVFDNGTVGSASVLSVLITTP